MLLALLCALVLPLQPVSAGTGRAAGEFTYPNQPAQQDTAAPTEATGTAEPGVIITSTPNADGSIAHVVQFGETLIEIAQAYGITLNQLYANNNSLDPQNPQYYAGEVLFIRLKNTSTPVLSPTYTPRTPTRTVRATRTATQPGTPVPPQATTPTPNPSPTPAAKTLALDDRTIGYGFILVSLVGLVVVIFKGFIKAKS